MSCAAANSASFRRMLTYVSRKLRVAEHKEHTNMSHHGAVLHVTWRSYLIRTECFALSAAFDFNSARNCFSRSRHSLRGHHATNEQKLIRLTEADSSSIANGVNAPESGLNVCDWRARHGSNRERLFVRRNERGVMLQQAPALDLTNAHRHSIVRRTISAVQFQANERCP